MRKFVEETWNAVNDILQEAPHIKYLNFQNELDEEFFTLPNDAQNMINAYRELKSKIHNCAQAIDDEWTDDKISQKKTALKLLQHFYSKFLTHYAVHSYETHIRDSSDIPDIDKARTLSNNGNIAGAWLHQIPRWKGERPWDNTSFRRNLKLRLGVAFND